MKEKMNCVLHVLRKDFRHVRLLLGVWFLLTVLSTGIAVPFFNSLAPGTIDGQLALAFVILVAAEMMVLATIISRLVHDDSIVGSTAFWLSRPISRGVLLASKMLFLGLAIVLPKKLMLLYAASHLTVGDFLPPGFDWHQFLLFSVPQGVYLLLVAALTPSLTRMLLLGGTMASIGAGGLIGVTWLALHLDMLTSAGLEASMRMSTEIFALLGCIAVICHQYLTRRTTRSKILAFSGIAAYLLMFTVPLFLGAS